MLELFEDKIAALEKEMQTVYNNPDIRLMVIPNMDERSKVRSQEKIVQAVNMILRQAASYSGYHKREILSKSRKKELVKIRALCYFVLYYQYGLSYIEIGRQFSRDHSTVIHNITVLKTDSRIYPEVLADLRAFLRKCVCAGKYF